MQLTDHSDEEWQRAMKLYTGLDEAKAVADAAATLAFLRQHPACTGKVGAVGFCITTLASLLWKPDPAFRKSSVCNHGPNTRLPFRLGRASSTFPVRAPDAGGFRRSRTL